LGIAIALFAGKRYEIMTNCRCRGRAVRLLLIVLALMTGGVVTATAKPLPRSVLLITQSSPSSGGAIAMFAAFGSDPNVNSTSRIAVYTEHLDLNRFPSPQYRQLTRSYFRDKYRETPIGVVVVDGPVGLDLVLSWRDEMWSEVPVVFSGVDEVSVAQLNLPPNVTGFVAHQTFRGMVDAARVLVPGLKRVALVGDPPERDAYRRNYRQEIAALAAEIEFIDLTGLAVTEVKERVAVLPNDAVVFYFAIFVDGAGVVHTPQSALLDISGVTSRPIIIDVESQLGYGAVGGFVFSLASAAREAVRLAVRILDGENASQIPVAKIDLNRPIFDGRELKRWNISEDRLPPGSEIRFREFSIWEQYRWQMTSIFAALLVQAAMISWLLLERRGRHSAELESHARLQTVIHLDRVAAVGAMSASIAHELNQPLGAILANAETAELLLGTTPVDHDQLKVILADIRQSDRRAADIIAHMRGLLKKQSETDLQGFDLNEAIQEALHMLDPEARKRGVLVSTYQTHDALPVRADQVHLEQVILNLATNAMDAMQGCAPGTRKLMLQTALVGDSEVEVSLSDSGTGIPKDKLDDIFETFYTTKKKGIGLGLSIVRTIVEASGGKIWAENRLGGGAVFRFTLPLSKGHPP
jgi:signal transduction histidine kinase